MNAQTELEEILIKEAKVESKSENLIRLKSLAERVTAAMGGEVVSRTRNTDPMSTSIAAKEKVEKELARLQEEYEQHREFMSSIVDSLRKPAYIKILYGVYFNGKDLTTVADQIGYSYRHTQDLRDDAVRAVQKKLDEFEKSHKIS